MNTSATQNLLPISELMPQKSAGSTPPVEPDTENHEKKRILQLLDVEIKKIIATQEKNKEEIEKREKDIKTLTDNNLVLLGAMSAIKKIRAEV